MIRRKEVFKKGKQVLAMALSGAMIAAYVPGGVGGPRVVRADPGFQKSKSNSCYGVNRIKRDTTSAGIGKWNYVMYGNDGKGNSLKCRVLSMDAVIDSGGRYQLTDSKATSSKLMLLDSETSVGMMNFTDCWYRESPIKTMLDGVFKKFDVREQKAVPNVSASKDRISEGWDYYYEDSPIEDNIFILGYRDITNTKFGYDAEGSNDNKKGKEWETWTRCVQEPNGISGYTPKTEVRTLTKTGYVSEAESAYNKDVYPTFCLEENKVLFSTAIDGKMDEAYGSTYKLTVYDENMVVEFANGNKPYIYPDSNIIAVPYSIKGTNANKVEQLSVYVIDNSNWLQYYAPVKTGSLGTSGVVSFELPDDFPISKIGPTSTYRLFLIAEDVNDDNHTDFASKGLQLYNFASVSYVGDGTTDSITVKGGAPNDSKLTIFEPDNIIYDGKRKRAHTNDYDQSLFPGDVTIDYYVDDVNPGNSIKDEEVVEPGNYAARLLYTYNSKKYTAKVNFTIMPGYSEVVTEPKAKSLKENGSAQELVTKGTALHGTMLYALGDNGDTPPAVENFTSDIPTAKAAGTYYVWYMIKGDEFYRGLPGHLVTAKIDKSGDSSDKNPNEGNKDDGQNNQGENGNLPAPVAQGNTIENESASFVVTSSDAKNATVTYEASKKTAATSVTIPDTVNIGDVEYKITQISPKAFYKNKKIRKVKIGKYVTVIGNSAFYGCIALTTVSGGTGVKKIGANAFNGCKKLTKAPIGAKVTSIGDKAFYKCAGVKTMTIPVNVSKLGKQFAYGTKNLTTLTVKTIKLKDKSISTGAFKGAGSKKTKAVVPKGMKKEYTTLFRQKGGLNKKIKFKESK